MFGRRKHAAPVVTAPAVPQLTDELIFAAVQERLVELFGDRGQWTVARRAAEETDAIFRDVFVHAVATRITSGVTATRDGLATRAGAAAALRVPRPEPEPFEWQPAPITMWTDLKRPVTGEIAVIDGKDLAA